MKTVQLLFAIFIASTVAPLCAVDDGQSQFLIALLIHEKTLHARSTASIDAQTVSAVGLLKEFDDAYAKKDVERASVVCCRFKWLGGMDWRYLTEDQQVEHCGKVLHAEGLLNGLKNKKNWSAFSNEDLAADVHAAQWLIDRINQGLCTSEVWKGFGDDFDNRFPESNVLNAERIAYLKRAGKPQEMAE